jgi:hypothetical protein
MFRRYLAQVTVAAVAADFLLALGTVEIVYLLRFRPGLEIAWDEALPSPAVALLVYSAAWVAILWISGHYRLRMVRSPTADAFVVGRATLALAALMLSLLYLLRGSDVSRLFLLGLFPAQFLATLVFKEPIRGLLRYLSSRRLDAHRVLIVGANDRARHFASQLLRHPEYGVRVVGFLQEDGALTPPPDVVGSVNDILTVLERVVVDEVAICLPRSAWEKTEAIIALCEEAGKSVRIPLDLPGEARSTGYVESVGGLPVYSIVSGPDRMLSLAVKRTFDIVASLSALVVLAPVLVLVGLLLIVVQRRPILFRQMRVGIHGRLFAILKFRTMIADAEAHRSEFQLSSSTMTRVSHASVDCSDARASTNSRSFGTCWWAR